MIVPFWAAQNPSLWKSLFPGFFFAFSFLGNFPTSVGDHDMGVVTLYYHSTLLLLDKVGVILGIMECRGFLHVPFAAHVA